MPSQWSLTFEVRKRAVSTVLRTAFVSQSQWSLTFEVRKRCVAACTPDMADESQWSLTFEVRKRLGTRHTPPGTRFVAMEPDL